MRKVLSLSVVAWFLVGCGDGLAGYSLLGTGTERRDIDASKVSSIHVAADNADVIVLGEEGVAEVSVIPLVTGDPGNINVVVALSPDGELAVAISNDGDCSALRVKVITPPATDYQVAVDTGDVTVHGMEVGGQVAVDKGSARLAVVPTTELQVAVDEGDILVELPAGTDIDLKAAVDEGTITVEDFTFDGSSTERALDGRLNGGGDPAIQLAADKGNIVLRAHAADHAAETDGGNTAGDGADAGN